jgi:hypothetical protein
MGDAKHRDPCVGFEDFATAGGFVILANEVSFWHWLKSLSAGDLSEALWRAC